MNLAFRKDAIIFLLIVILAFMIGNNVLNKIYLNKIDALKMQIENEKKKNDVLAIIAIVDKKLEKYQKRSFSSAEITQLLDTVSELAEQSNVEIETFNPLPTEYKEHHVELPLMLPIRCGYRQLGKFLSLIESNMEFIRVEELGMQKDTATDPKNKSIPKIDLKLSGLYLKE